MIYIYKHLLLRYGYKDNQTINGGVFSMGTKVGYPIEVKMKAIEKRLAGTPVKQVLEELIITLVCNILRWTA